MTGTHPRRSHDIDPMPTTAPPPPTSDHIPNFRDLASTINPLTTHPLHPTRLYRSARPDPATDLPTLHTILDLRTPTELAASPRLPRHHDIPTHHIDLHGRAYTSALLHHLTWPQTLHLAALYALGRRTAAIAVLGRHVLAPRGLTGLALDTLTHSTAAVRAVFARLADARNYPVLIHCTHGKDRTGLVVVLVLLVLGVEREAIEADYRASEGQLWAGREERVEEARAMGLDEGFVGCEEGFVGGVMGWLEERWGGVEGYLGHCGVEREEMEGVRRVLLASS